MYNKIVCYDVGSIHWPHLLCALIREIMELEYTVLCYGQCQKYMYATQSYAVYIVLALDIYESDA